MTVWWIRHGTCEDGNARPDAHARPASRLSSCGRREARLAAARLRRQRFELVLVASSPLLRARQTATLIADALGAPLAAVEADFAEWRAPDCVLGRSPAHYPDAYREWRGRRAKEPDTVLLGGESLRDFAKRAARARALAQQLASDAGPILIVSHRMLIGAVAAVAAGLARPADIFHAARGFNLGPCRLWTPT